MRQCLLVMLQAKPIKSLVYLLNPELKKHNKHRYARVDGQKSVGSQPYTKNEWQLRNTESQRNSQGKSTPLGYPMPNCQS